jgi:replicative DNA helicase
MHQGAKTLGFSLEDSQEDKTIKLIANIADISQKRLMLGHTDGIQDRIAHAEQKLRQYAPIIYDDIYTIEEIRLKIKKHKLKDKVNIVWLDYIQNIQGSGDHYDRISRAVIALQKIAKELEVTIIILSQVTNESMKANTEIIGLKGAGELAAAPDIILWLKRTKGEGRERFLDVEIRKNRPFGETGIRQFIFSESWARILKRGV